MLSVVIPTLNAAASLGDCLERMKAADELVVVDGGSSDSSVAIAESAGARLIIAPRGRGAQLRAGGEAAVGDWLLFLHADSLPGPGWRSAVDSHCASHPQSAACFGFRLADRSWQARWLERAVALRVKLVGLAYGDQGLLIPSALYQKLGGYRDLPLMEDVDLVRRLGRSRLRSLEESVWTSAERWRRDGWVRRSARNLSCLLLYRLGLSPARIAKLYA